jgi:hypothetical protein
LLFCNYIFWSLISVAVSCRPDCKQGEEFAFGRDCQGFVLFLVIPSTPLINGSVPDAEGREDLTSPWFVFNDFAVQNITEAEALSFPASWKVRLGSSGRLDILTMCQIPAILYYERVDRQDAFDFSGLPSAMDPGILSHDTSISLYVSLLHFSPLNRPLN